VERVSEIPVSADWSKPEVCIIELGGTIGDIEGMAFVEAFRYNTMLQCNLDLIFESKKENLLENEYIIKMGFEMKRNYYLLPITYYLSVYYCYLRSLFYLLFQKH
jgi:hypothetical protein